MDLENRNYFARINSSHLLTFLNIKKIDPVVHFEIPAKDKERMKKFYESAFGWETKQLGKEMGEYILVTTAERDEKTGY